MRENQNSITNTDDSTLKVINELLLNLQTCQECDDDMKDWFKSDSNDQIMSIANSCFSSWK